jgi:peptide deformylase
LAVLEAGIAGLASPALTPAAAPCDKPGMPVESPAPPPPGPAIVQVGDPVLRARAAEVTKEQLATPDIQALLARMRDAMRAAPGVGLAAPQLGVGLRIFVMEDPEPLIARLTPEERGERERTPFPFSVWVNPEVVPAGDAKATFFEGCLSLTGYTALVERALEVDIRGLDEHGAPQTLHLRGWPARIVQHELDHLDGALYIDRMRSRSFSTQAHAKERFAGRPIAEIRRALGE